MLLAINDYAAFDDMFKKVSGVIWAAGFLIEVDLQYDARPTYRQFLIKSVGDLTF